MNLPVGAKHLVFTMNYQLRDDQVFAILAPNWPTPLLAPGPPKGDSGRSRESPGRVWRSSVRVLGGPIYRKTPDQPPQRPLCYPLLRGGEYWGTPLPSPPTLHEVKKCRKKKFSEWVAEVSRITPTSKTTHSELSRASQVPYRQNKMFGNVRVFSLLTPHSYRPLAGLLV